MMTDKEKSWDKLLQIKTVGRDDKNSDEYRYPYEPTPYCVLERLAQTELFGRDDTVLDYGCGKGRVGFFLSYKTGARSIGIEYDERIYESAIENQKTSAPRAKSDFVLTRAEEYEVPVKLSAISHDGVYDKKPALAQKLFFQTSDELDLFYAPKIAAI